MKCQRCGAELLDTDTFCVKCGQKVGEPARCPVCGEILREGTKFCHKCGAAVNSEDTEPHDEEIPVTPQKTIDIPFDVIEKSIIMEAEQAVVKRDFSEAEARLERERRGEKPEYPEKENPETARNPERKAEKEPEGNESEGKEPEEIPAPVMRERLSRVVEAVREGRIYEQSQEDADSGEEPAGQKRTDRQKVSRRRNAPSCNYGHEEDRYEDTGYEDTDYDGDGYDDDDLNDEEASGGFDLTRVTMILGIVVLIVIVIGGGIILKKKLHFDFSNIGDTTVSEPTGENNGNAGENTGENTPGEVAGKLQIIKNVNMRNRPGTENSSILGVAKTGEVYEYYELVGDSWYHIRLSDGSEAYVYKEYVDVLN